MVLQLIYQVLTKARKPKGLFRSGRTGETTGPRMMEKFAAAAGACLGEISLKKWHPCSRRNRLKFKEWKPGLFWTGRWYYFGQNARSSNCPLKGMQKEIIILVQILFPSHLPPTGEQRCQTVLVNHNGIMHFLYQHNPFGTSGTYDPASQLIHWNTSPKRRKWHHDIFRNLHRIQYQRFW